VANSIDGGGVTHKALRQLSVGKHSGTLTSRIMLVAFVSVISAIAIAMLVAFPLVRSEAQAQARDVLARQADVVVDLIRQGSTDRPLPGRGDHQHLPGPEVAVIPITSDTAPTGLISAAVIAAVTGESGDFVDDSEQDDNSGIDADGGVSQLVEFDHELFFIEGRQIANGAGVVLVQRAVASQDAAATLLTRMGYGLIAGLGIAALIAMYVARRTAAPLKKAANAAMRLSQGERDVDVEVTGAEEIADLARALNLLAANLAISEDRQREFFMSVSHELRTPMTAVKGYAEALADGIIDGEDVAPTGSLLTGETDRLDRLISDLLDLARAGAVDFRLSVAPADLSSIVADASESWRLRCEREGLSFESVQSAGELHGTIDAMRYRQILDNLVENAVRVTPAGGSIRVTLAETETGSELVIEDSGPGLADADLAVAFEPALLHTRYRGVRPVGTGLGLALVGSLARRMGGTAEAGHSDLGGAKFVVKMPREVDLQLAD
jgi:two-component system sensor histidine kinase BaeS